MEDPPGSPAIKAEPQDIPDGAPPVNTGEIILISDDEDETAAPANIRTLGSPFQEESHDSGAVNLGPSMLSTTKPKPAKPSAKEAFAGVRAKIAAKQRENTEKHKMAAQPAQPAQRTQRTPLAGRSDLFVTESNPGTPDPAEIFRALQRDFEEKRQDGTLTWQEEIEFERAQATEKARVLKERLDQAYDGSDVSVADGEDPRMSPSVASLPDEDVEEPKKRGRKRKADASSKPQPKKRRTAAPKSAEDILVTARRKMEAKAKAKAAKGKQAPKKGRKTKPTAPDLLNTASMLGSNVFADTARMRDVPDQPTFGPDHDNRKDKALRSLIASVPEEYRPIAKTDKKFLEDAMKDFTGRGAVTPAEDGNWNVKGLRVTLKHYQVHFPPFVDL